MILIERKESMDLLYQDRELLKKKVREVKKMFPWYEQLCENAEIDNIKDLPLMTQKVLEENYYDKLDGNGYSVYMTSGTSKKGRKKVYYSKKDDEEYIRIKKDIYENIISDLDGTVKAMADMGTGHAASTAQIVFEQLGCITKSISFELPIEEHIRILSEFCPDVLYTMPSILDSIIFHSNHPDQYGVRKIILVGEVASKSWIEKVAKAFGITPEQIFDTYGSIEIGTLAHYSHKHKKYILAEGLFGEGLQPCEIDPILDDLRENESILVLTSLVRNTFPALRFITFDVVRDLKTEVIDEKTVQTFSCIVKRVGNEIKHGEKISIYDIENVVYQYIDNAEIRVNIVDNKLTIFIKSNELNTEKMKLIQEGVQDAIPEIGSMIKNHILEEIKVIEADVEKNFEKRIKNKRIYG